MDTGIPHIIDDFCKNLPNPHANNLCDLIDDDLEIVANNPSKENIMRITMKLRSWFRAGILTSEQMEHRLRLVPKERA